MKMPISLVQTSALVAALVLAPAGVWAQPAKAPATAATKVLPNVSYGPGARQRFDVYQPVRPTGPVLLMVHGGGWARGDKADPRWVRDKVAHWGGLGYTVVSANYPLWPKAGPMEQALSVAMAMAKVQARAAEWGADPKRLVLVGEESGSHLAALITVVPTIAKQAGVQPWRATIGIDPAYMSLEEVMKAPHDKALDKVIGTTEAQWQALSPRYLVADGPPPPPLMMWCYKQRANSCDLALHYERKAAKFKHQIVIWQRMESQDTHVKALDVWLAAMVKP